ncbi:mycothione reductase [Antrihabitans sp. YC2-6]|uniref:mycothione reductase n=1 Tax=Antrihabitans sp. YC2-6 TaxID=2799498 RepID=UPI0018F5C290|nr:mycothione reductase [Antrihabitans sp. YC2-6]MBJ8344932.1 mycothione reductase [Antrihabitans sp. YC2-6]
MSARAHFDLAIIGTGSGNTILTRQFAGKKVAILEAATFGGTCINVGCIPTKMFVYAADVATTIARSSKYGIDAHVDKIRWPDIVDRVFGRIDAITTDAEDFRRNRTEGATLFTGRAHFVGPRTLDTGTGSVITADQIVVAAGSRPIVPDEIRNCGEPFYTSDDIMRIRDLPERLIILGAGFIAAEFAHVFSAFGVDVTIIARGERLLRHLDADISAHFTTLAQAKWDVRLGRTAVTMRKSGAGVSVELDDGSCIEGDAMLVATGRQPNSDWLDAAAGGIELHDDGRVKVDEYQRTSAEGVFALGDISSPYQLKHVANHEARIVRDNLLRNAWQSDVGLARTDHQFVPAAVFTDPQIADVGLTEEAAREAGYDVVVNIHKYADVAYGWAMEDDTGLCKVVLERGTGKILGAHIIGYQAPTIIQPLIQAMQFGLDARSMARGQYWIHPALPEVVENALLGALKKEH